MSQQGKIKNKSLLNFYTGGAVEPGPPFEIVASHFTFGPPVAAYTQYCFFKCGSPFWFLAPPSGFWPPLLLNPGDGLASIHNKNLKVFSRRPSLCAFSILV